MKVERVIYYEKDIELYNKGTIIITGDLYRGDQCHNIEKLCILISPLLKGYSGKISCIKKVHTQVSYINSLMCEGRSWMKDVVTANALVIGFELSDLDKLFMKKSGISYIDICIHPIRFGSDLYFSVTSNSQEIIHDIEANINFVSDLQLKVYSNSFIANKMHESSMPTNSLLLVGQTQNDKSVFFDGHFKNLTDFFEKIDALSAHHEKILYKPHPLNSDKYTNQVILKRYNAQLIENVSFYDLLADRNIQHVAAVSSSCVHEAFYFGKQGTFLENNVKEFSPPVTYQELLRFLFRNIGSLVDVDKDVARLEVANNYLRDYFGYWSYYNYRNDLEVTKNDLRSMGAEYGSCLALIKPLAVLMRKIKNWIK